MSGVGAIPLYHRVIDTGSPARYGGNDRGKSNPSISSGYGYRLSGSLRRECWTLRSSGIFSILLVVGTFGQKRKNNDPLRQGLSFAPILLEQLIALNLERGTQQCTCRQSGN